MITLSAENAEALRQADKDCASSDEECAEAKKNLDAAIEAFVLARGRDTARKLLRRSLGIAS